MGLFLRNEKYSKIWVKIRSLLQSKSAAPSTSAQTITSDSSYDGLNNVTVNGTISTTGTIYSLYYFNGSDLVLKELTGSDTLSVPKNSIIVVYSSWGTVNIYSTLTNAEQLLTTYSCDCGCGEAVTLFKVTGSNFKIPLS